MSQLMFALARRNAFIPSWSRLPFLMKNVLVRSHQNIVFQPRTFCNRCRVEQFYSSKNKLFVIPLNYLSRRFARSAAAAVVENAGNLKAAGRPKVNELRRLLSLAKEERWSITVAVVLLAITSGVTMSVPFFMGRIIDMIFGEKSDLPEAERNKQMMTRLRDFCVFLVGIFLVGAAANFGRVYLLESAGVRIVNRLRNNVFSSIVNQDVAFFDKNKTGELINRLSNDASAVQYAVTMNISDGLRSIAAAVGGVSMMVYVSPKLAIVGLGTVPPVAIAAIFYGRYIRKLTQQVNDALAAATQVAEERLSNIRTVRAFSAESKEILRYADKTLAVQNLGIKYSFASGTFFGLTGLSGNLILLAVLYSGGSLMANHEITVGDLSSFLLYAGYVGMSIAGMTSFYSELMHGLGATTRLWELIDRKPAIPLLGGVRLDKVRGEIELKDVIFAYPERANAPIFNEINLTIPAGSVTALVGPSGVGKSTLAALLLRYYDTAQGGVFLDGKNVRELDPSWLRSITGTVAQEPVLFSGTIKENIAYGAPGASMEDIVEAAKQANAFNFIKAFPQEFDTMVGERGIALSGGQKQRVAIARALVKKPRIFILDEATSALDAESEHFVKEALDRLLSGGDKTVIMIAHRLSTIKHADQIAVLNEGKIVELGSFYDLLSIENGLFRKLVERQTIKDESEDEIATQGDEQPTAEQTES